MAGDKISIESLKVELACLYYLQLPAEKRSKGRDLCQNLQVSYFINSGWVRAVVCLKVLAI